MCSLALSTKRTSNLNITVATRMTAVGVIGRLDEFQMGKDDFNCYIKKWNNSLLSILCLRINKSQHS